MIEAGITSLLRRPEKYGPITEMQERVLRRVLRNTKVTQALVGDALELGRSREGIVNLADSRISDMIRQTLVEIFDLTDGRASEKIKNCSNLSRLRETLEEKGLALFIDQDLWSQKVCLDAGKVTQILRNLLNNALKYRKNRMEVKFEKTDTDLVFSVKDDGDGIPSSYHEHIFKCYFQMDATDVCPVRGHGLGLAGVMVLIEDMGGKLFLESDEGKGAKFMIEVPLVKGPLS